MASRPLEVGVTRLRALEIDIILSDFHDENAQHLELDSRTLLHDVAAALVRAGASAISQPP